jgi:hypothetical protein
MSLMPCFKKGEALIESMVLAHLYAGYGELEVCLLACLIALEGQMDTPVRMLFGTPGAEKRIKQARKALLPEFTKAALRGQLVETLGDMDWCRKIRNQYSHCQWYWTRSEGLCFVNIEHLAKQPNHILKLMDNKRRIDGALLTKQVEYFNYVKESLSHLESAYRAWDRHRTAPRKFIHVFPMPPKIARPPAHN